ncbi:hypothetical protein EP7_002038 [Isosphaeraceae bacterium EP7]
MIDNDGLHGMQERSAARTLAAGLHAIRVEFFENGGGAGVVLSWSGPGIAKQAIPASLFSQPTEAIISLAGFASVGLPHMVSRRAADPAAGRASRSGMPAIGQISSWAPGTSVAIKPRPFNPDRIVTPRLAALRPSRFTLGALISHRSNFGDLS